MQGDVFCQIIADYTGNIVCQESRSVLLNFAEWVSIFIVWKKDEQ